MTTEWEPCPTDILFMEELIRIVNERCVWVTSFGVYQFDKENKTLKLDKVLNEDFREGLHDRNIKVLEKMGWRMDDATGE